MTLPDVALVAVGLAAGLVLGLAIGRRRRGRHRHGPARGLGWQVRPPRRRRR